MRKVLFGFLFALSLAPLPAFADDATPTADAFKAIITHQLKAIAADDGQGAYADAAPNVHQIFPSADVFMLMVRNGYPPVYRNKQYNFTETGVDATGRPTQRVEILGADGVRYEALYFMEHEGDGSWKISGVLVARVDGQDA